MKDLFLFALSSLKARKLRSWLTIIGVVIGIAAVVALILIGKGMQLAIEEQFEKAGADKILIFPGKDVTAFGLLGAEKFTDREVELIKKVKGVEKAGGMVVKIAKVKWKKEIKYTFVTGLAEEFTVEDFTGIELEAGRGEAKKDTDAVIGYLIYHGEFFEKPLKIGEKILIQDKEFKVVGSLSRIGNRQDDTQIYILLKTAQELFEEKGYSIILVKVKKGFDTNEVADAIKEALRKDRGLKKGEEDFSVKTMGQLLSVFSNVLLIIQIIVSGIAGISLVVGGVGIMNTMYTSILERTKQIGVMKAIGAKDKDILLIFVLESAIIGAIGGLIGILFGISIAKSMELFAKVAGFYLIKITLLPEVILLAFFFSIFIGIVSGFMPAKQAAKLNPVEALRYE